MAEGNDNHILVESLYGLHTKQPLVELSLNEERVQMPIYQARKIAVDLIECAAAAETDALVYAAMVDMGAGEETAARMILQVRKQREKKEAQS